LIRNKKKQTKKEMKTLKLLTMKKNKKKKHPLWMDRKKKDKKRKKQKWTYMKTGNGNECHDR
jgi:hypothetical protein